MCSKVEEAVEQYLDEHWDDIADRLIEIISDRLADKIEREKIYEEVGRGKDRLTLAVEILNGEREVVTGDDVAEGIGHMIRRTL